MDPFSEENKILCNIATGVVLPEEGAHRMVRIIEQGLMLLDCFVLLVMLIKESSLYCGKIRNFVIGIYR